MLLNWTEKHPLSIWSKPPKKEGDEPPRAELGFTLLPGINEIDDKAFKAVETHPRIKFLMKERSLNLVSAKPKKDAKGDGLMVYEQGDAQDIIKNTYDKRLLKKWLLAEERLEIKQAIDVQLQWIDDKTTKKPEPEKVYE